jgi:hypothetical protein
MLSQHKSILDGSLVGPLIVLVMAAIGLMPFVVPI